MFSSTKVHKKTHFLSFFSKYSIWCNFSTNFNISQSFHFQRLTKKLQKRPKKNAKKRYNVLKKCLTLQRFNKQMIVLQI